MSLKISTIQLAKAKRLTFKGTLIDTTAKKGQSILAPTWCLVLDYKRGCLSNEQYTELYLELLRKRYKATPEYFHEILTLDHVVLACMCREGDFCHRKIAVDVLLKIAERLKIQAEYTGEINEQSSINR